MRIGFQLFSLFIAATLGSALNIRGADISSLTLVENNGIRYKDYNGNTKNFETILKENGANTIRIRIWTGNGQYSTSYGLALARRIKAAGLSLMVDLHYSDTWADPGHQSIPSGWGTSVSSLNTAIWTYTRDIVTAFNNQGTPIDILQIGNEINDGFLWPTGKASSSGWSNPSQFLNSAREGARAAGFGGKVLVHIADGWNAVVQDWFWDHIFVQGAFETSDFDYIGVSFYPFYNTAATFNNLRTQLQRLASKFPGKRIIVAETDFPATNSCSSSTPFSETSIPKTPAGQQTWTSRIRDVVASLPSSSQGGILYWEPGWIGNAHLGSSCGDNLLVDSSGRARASIDIFNRM